VVCPLLFYGVDKSWAEKFPSGSIYDPEITR